MPGGPPGTSVALGTVTPRRPRRPSPEKVLLAACGHPSAGRHRGRPSTKILRTHWGRHLLLRTRQRSLPPGPCSRADSPRNPRPSWSHTRCGVHTYVHTQGQPLLTPTAQCQPCSRGQDKCSFCQFHRRIHNQSNKNKQGGPVSHGLTDQHVEKGRRSAALSILTPVPPRGYAERQGRTGRAPELCLRAGAHPTCWWPQPQGPGAGRPRISPDHQLHQWALLQHELTQWPTYGQNARRQS